MHSASVTFLSRYVEWKNVGQHRRAPGLPPPKRKDSKVSPLNGIRLDETVGNGLAHSVGEAAPENRFSFHIWWNIHKNRTILSLFVQKKLLTQSE